jgi:hypothetical protein
MAHAGGPVKVAKLFHAGYKRLRETPRSHGCFVNGSDIRSRSGCLEVLTYKTARHPLAGTAHEGVLVLAYAVWLRRNGDVAVSKGRHIAFLSWHALGRLRERGTDDIFVAGGLVAGCGMAGLLMRESLKHVGSGIYFAFAFASAPCGKPGMKFSST